MATLLNKICLLTVLLARNVAPFVHLVEHGVVALVNCTVVLLLHHRELHVDDGFLLGGDVLRHVLLPSPQHVRLQSSAQSPRLRDTRIQINENINQRRK